VQTVPVNVIALVVVVEIGVLVGAAVVGLKGKAAVVVNVVVTEVVTARHTRLRNPVPDSTNPAGDEQSLLQLPETVRYLALVHTRQDEDPDELTRHSAQSAMQLHDRLVTVVRPARQISVAGVLVVVVVVTGEEAVAALIVVVEVVTATHMRPKAVEPRATVLEKAEQSGKHAPP
jgi:hypothetical protein